ncbi:CU044_5270 family protein [Nonomuraea guangzhouensis]|uniref:CU044_5270 family protein n=1 Tax=Nonomuraea guangzhouensis TaxID=1291555 RepID=A0ABW4GY86_9ACTN|nr:CU044_5270 family protein [Nonomuraea guangzhouensis]
MDELSSIRELYGEPPADPALKARVRERLEAERRPSSRKSWLFSWRAAVGGLAAAVAVAAVVALVSPRTAGQTGSVVSGRSILLAAATTAASGPAGKGTYWHIEKLHDGTKVTDLWATRDGKAWTGERPAGRSAKVVVFSGRKAPFSMAGKDLTFEQIQRLPTDPAALKEWVVGMLPAGSGDGVLADAVSGLLWSKPSPPGVRAAAYRLLGDLPNVHYLGRSTDQRGRTGDAFAFELDGEPAVERTLIIDVASSQVLSCTDDAGAYGGGRQRSEVVLVAGWTDKGPAVSETGSTRP